MFLRLKWVHFQLRSLIVSHIQFCLRWQLQRPHSPLLRDRSDKCHDAMAHDWSSDVCSSDLSLYHNMFGDYVAMIIAVLGISVPSFILAALLQYVFAIKMGAFPIAKFDSFAHTILPAVAIATTPLAFIARLMRSSMLDVLSSDYIKTAKAKGLNGRVTVYRHGIRNAILPVVSYLGPLVVQVLTGSFIIEKIFAIPGLGNEFVTSITNRDYTVIMGTTVFFSVLLLVSILIVDIIYGFIDPRIKITGKGDQ